MGISAAEVTFDLPALGAEIQPARHFKDNSRMGAGGETEVEERKKRLRVLFYQGVGRIDEYKVKIVETLGLPMQDIGGDYVTRRCGLTEGFGYGRQIGFQGSDSMSVLLYKNATRSSTAEGFEAIGPRPSKQIQEVCAVHRRA